MQTKDRSLWLVLFDDETTETRVRADYFSVDRGTLVFWWRDSGGNAKLDRQVACYAQDAWEAVHALNPVNGRTIAIDTDRNDDKDDDEDE